MGEGVRDRTSWRPAEIPPAILPGKYHIGTPEWLGRSRSCGRGLECTQKTHARAVSAPAWSARFFEVLREAPLPDCVRECAVIDLALNLEVLGRGLAAI